MRRCALSWSVSSTRPAGFADFHVHQLPSSDSSIELPDRVMSLVAEGVEFVAATDHNHVTDFAPAIEQLGVNGLLSATTGVEITTPTWGHFNTFPLSPASRASPFLNVTPASIFARVREVSPSSVIQVNHPRMKGCGYFARAELDTKDPSQSTMRTAFSFDFDTLEVMNGLELDQKTTSKATCTNGSTCSTSASATRRGRQFRLAPAGGPVGGLSAHLRARAATIGLSRDARAGGKLAAPGHADGLDGPFIDGARRGPSWPGRLRDGIAARSRCRSACVRPGLDGCAPGRDVGERQARGDEPGAARRTT